MLSILDLCSKFREMLLCTSVCCFPLTRLTLPIYTLSWRHAISGDLNGWVAAFPTNNATWTYGFFYKRDNLDNYQISMMKY